MLHNFEQIRASLTSPEELARLQPLEQWTRDCWEALRPELRARKQGGHVRECHGDLHLGNIALDGDELIIFDGIEFNPGLRWIDTISDAAFLMMDLEHGGRRGLAHRFLDRYLARGGDYAGVALLRFYQVYRAMVRAKVEAIRLRQPDLDGAERRAIAADYARYLETAETYTQRRKPALLITHGLSGAGKSHATGVLLEELGMVRLRSDVERKRLYPFDDADRYDSEATERTYQQLWDMSAILLAAGWPVAVDATFLGKRWRDRFRALAEARGIPFVVLQCVADVNVLRERVRRRALQGTDASEAGPQVLERQLASVEPMAPDEKAWVCRVESAVPLPLKTIRERLGLTPRS